MRSDLPGSLEEWHAFEQACFDEGLLTHGFGKLPRITKKGRELVKQYALVDEEVRNALQDALRQRWIDKRAAFVTVLKLAVITRNARGFPTKERESLVDFRVGAWRASAEHLREHDGEFYGLLLAQANGTDEEAARDDPDGYVALALSKQADRYAQQLRAEAPKRYAAILETANAVGAEDAARLDPDAYVGMYLAEEEEGNLPPELRVED